MAQCKDISRTQISFIFKYINKPLSFSKWKSSSTVLRAHKVCCIKQPEQKTQTQVVLKVIRNLKVWPWCLRQLNLLFNSLLTQTFWILIAINFLLLKFLHIYMYVIDDLINSMHVYPMDMCVCVYYIGIYPSRSISNVSICILDLNK